MTDVSLPAARFADRGFSVGNAMNQSITVLSRNLLPFGTVTAVASLPSLLVFNRHDAVIHSPADAAWYVGGALAAVVLGALSQATVLYGAFEDMRGRPVDIMASVALAWRRFFSVIGVALGVGFLAGLACLALVIPGIILFTMWYVATPACVVEQIGPRKSMSRSAALTKGNRWKIFGMMILLAIIGGIGAGMTEGFSAGAGPTIGLVVKLIWSALFGAFSAILVVVTYHDLRVAKEGVDTDQIAAVFE